MRSMFEELKARGNKIAVKRSIFGLAGTALIFILFSKATWRVWPN